jgi:GNAT superfamily N-acetyltransferase
VSPAETIVRYWRANGIPFLRGARNGAIRAFEKRHAVDLPPDYRALLRRTNGTQVPGSYGCDDNGFWFFSVDELRIETLKGVRGIVFADYRESCWWYALGIGGVKTPYPVLIFDGVQPILVAGSFAEFTAHYVLDSERLYRPVNHSGWHLDAFDDDVVADWRSIRSGGTSDRAADLETLVAGEQMGFLSFHVEADGSAVLVAIEAKAKRIGIGAALLDALVERLRARGVTRLRLTTSNDNTEALRFFQRHGFHITAVNRGALDEARRLLPTIPATGHDDIPIRDEIVLEREL